MPRVFRIRSRRDRQTDREKKVRSPKLASVLLPEVEVSRNSRERKWEEQRYAGVLVDRQCDGDDDSLFLRSKGSDIVAPFVMFSRARERDDDDRENLVVQRAGIREQSYIRITDRPLILWTVLRVQPKMDYVG